MAIITLPGAGFTFQGVHSPTLPYKRNDVVRDATNASVLYVAYSFDVPASTSLYESGYWKVFMEGIDQPDEFPIGGIIMWSGEIVTIPAGWALCDGLNGTPNLKDKFVIGAGSTYNVADAGGSKDAVAVAHSHTINHDHPSTTSSSNGAHTHSYVYKANSYLSGANGGAQYAWYNTTSVNTGSAGAHTHTTDIPAYSGSSGTSGQSGTDKNLPPYYAMAYIMKV